MESHAHHLEDLDVPDATVGGRSHAFARPDLSTFCRLDELGLVVAGQRLESDRAVPSRGSHVASSAA